MEKVQGFVENGNLVITVGGVSAAQKAQGSYPQAQVAVYLAGTTTLATIYADNLATPTPKANPFTAQTNGYFYFYAANGRYDVTFSGGGLAAPLTFGDILLADPFAGQTNVNSVTGGPGIIVAPTTGNVVVTNQWGAQPSGQQLQYLRLKPNTGNNTTWEMAYLPYRNVEDYNFPAQSPGGNLTVGLNVITLAPVPLGVNGTDTNHYVYISGGIGTAEAVLISGGSAVSGAASGTVIINCANTHSGAWTIQSATAGIQEAINILPSTGGTVIVPAGNHPVFGGVRVSGSATAIVGVHGASITDNTPSGMNLFHFFRPGAAGGRNTIKNLYITCLKSSDSVIYIDGQNTMLVRDVYIQGGTPTGIMIAPNANTFDVYIQNVNVSLGSAAGGTGIAILSSGATKPSGIYLSQVQLASGQIGLHITGCGGLYVNQTDIIACGTGMRIDPADNGQVAFLWFSDVTVDTASGNGIEITPTGTGSVQGVEFTRVWSATHTGQGIFVQPAATAIVDGLRLIGCRMVNNQQYGMQLMGGINTHLIDCTLAGNSTGNIGIFDGLMVGAGVKKFQIIGGTFGVTDGHLNSQAFGILVSAGASDEYQITNTNCRGNIVAPLNDQGTGLTKIVKDNAGVDDGAFNTIASAATINLGSSGQATYFISGTTAITTIQGGWRGRVISLIFQTASPGGVTAGGNIARAQTAVQYQPIRLQYDGTVWF